MASASEKSDLHPSVKAKWHLTHAIKPAGNTSFIHSYSFIIHDTMSTMENCNTQAHLGSACPFNEQLNNRVCVKQSEFISV